MMERERVQMGVRFGLMATGMLALIAGLWAGLLRLGWAGPMLQPDLHLAHGPLFITLGSVGLVAIFGVVLSIHAAPFAIVMAGGAVAWAVGNGLWLAGWPIYALVPWWMGFLVLTIAGERLEPSRMLFHAPRVEQWFLGLVAALGLGLVLTLPWPDVGFRVMGAALVAVAGWLAVYDIARRTVRGEGLTRFIAVCLLAGYAWLAVGGALALVYGNPGAGPIYDAILHAVFVGFVFSMIFGHAPVIFPSVLGIPISYRPVFYGHVALLHLSLLVRTGGDLGLGLTLRAWGGWGNAAAIVLFLAATVYSVLTGSDDGASVPVPHALEVAPDATPDDLQDLQLPAA